MTGKEFFVNAIMMIDVDGGINVPTVLYYGPKSQIHIGSSALALAQTRHQLNEDFKVQLGNIDSKSRMNAKRTFYTASNETKSALGLTSDFVHHLLQRAHQWLASNGLDRGTSILLAEPLSMQSESVSAEWLSNYRKNLESIVMGEGYDNIDFLPEPFAVFQYYRYGLRHPIVAGTGKTTALVIDFGGGTFDVCVIETTTKGDISQSGRNSKPLAASSQPFGGFYINQTIAEELLFEHFKTSSSHTMLKKGVGIYKNWRKGNQDLSTVAKEYRNFVEKFHTLIYEMENPKLALSKIIMDWRLDTTLNSHVPVNLPSNPFGSEQTTVNTNLSANRFREMFIGSVWEKQLKPVIRQTLQRGKEELRGAPITVVLLSGGSANIGWLRELIKGDFADELRDAEILQLPDFQEVVSKGLAAECARRFYTEESQGDFTSVTYNRLCLVLNPDGRGHSIRPFRPRTDGLPGVTDMPGVLLPSAYFLRGFMDRPMRWRFHLDKPPRTKLDYYFLRSSFDPDDLENLQNVMDHTVHTPDPCTFDSNLQVELVVKEDGTARPKFIYKNGQTAAESVVVSGRSFYLDMTYTPVTKSSKTYIGLDFGSSNTSLSYVDKSSVHIYQKRSAEKSWSDLSDLSRVLPYPLAEPICRYIGQNDAEQLARKALDLIENALSMVAYTTFLDYCSIKSRKDSKLFKSFRQRSIGPLWGFIKECLKIIGNQGKISGPYKELLEPELFGSVEGIVNSLTEFKHDKADPTKFDTLRPVQILTNLSNKVFTNNIFGYFEQVKKQKFGNKYEGIFRCAHGNPPFTKTFIYEGPTDFSSEQAFIVNVDRMEALSLMPLIFWENCDNHKELDNGHCYFFDKREADDSYSYKAVGHTCTCSVSNRNRYTSLADTVLEFTNRDSSTDFVIIGSLKELT